MIGLPKKSISAINKGDIESHIKMIHQLAKGCEGKLCLCVFGEDPLKGKSISPIVRHYEIGMVEKMLNDVISYTMKQHHNVYMPLTVIAHSVKQNRRGSKKDIVAVLGLCADFDDVDAKLYQDRLPLPADIVLETSNDRFQCIYVFSEPSEPKKADEAALLLQESTGCDYGTKDISHVWRIAGTLNHPNKKKSDDGRPLEPQSVNLIEDFGDTSTDVEKLIISCSGAIPAIKSVDQSREDFHLARKMVVDGNSDGEIALAIQALRGHDSKSQRVDYIERTIKVAKSGKSPLRFPKVKPAVADAHILLPDGEYDWTCIKSELNNRYKGQEKLYLHGLIGSDVLKLMMNNSGAYSSKLLRSWVVSMQRLPKKGEALSGESFVGKTFRVRVASTVPKAVMGTPAEQFMKTSIVTEIIDLIS